jgi:hypothetical protein
MPKENVKAPPLQTVGEESIEDKIKSQKQEEQQRKMEKDVFGDAVILPGKPGKAPEPKNLPGKPEKKKNLGEGATKYAKGGYVRAADGIAQRGKTKGRIV